jgi:hypothetical protein
LKIAFTYIPLKLLLGFCLKIQYFCAQNPLF